MHSLCPLNSSVPVEASGVIPVDQQDVSGIPSLALTIPDFEGQAILRIFSNSTQSEIACYSGVITNGATFSHPGTVATVIGTFTLAAAVASFATTAYVDAVATARMHYAHSLSIFVVFAVLQHIFFSGSLSMDWPSVLVAFWSNFAWSAGMIYSRSMQNSINQLIGSNQGNLTAVGSASSGTAAIGVGGGFNLKSIYKRANSSPPQRHVQMHRGDDVLQTRQWENSLARRAFPGQSSGVVGAADGYNWYGSPVAPGLPLPGNFSGFAGTLAEEGIPASSAFITGLVWLMILLVLVVAAIASLKWTLEALLRFRLVKANRLEYFRAHWIRYLIETVLRAAFIGFFMIMMLAMFEFSFQKTGPVVAIAAVIFLILFVGALVIAGYALFSRLRFWQFGAKPDQLHLTKTEVGGVIPWLGLRLESQRNVESVGSEQWVSTGSIPWFRLYYIDKCPPGLGAHQDEDYIVQFGWLTARFRRTRWWFFACWLVYEFIRASFYGGAAGYPMVQIFGLLTVEILALVAIVAVRPFEGARLNALMVYFLGFSKVATIALSAAFDARFDLQRITTTAIGIVIIVIQGVLASVLLIAIAIGCASSYMSITRNRSNSEFKPQHWARVRQRYFDHLEKSAADLPPSSLPPADVMKRPSFTVLSFHRRPKIEDEEPDPLDNSQVTFSSDTAYTSRANLIDGLNGCVTTVPFGAKVYRASWSIRDLDSVYGQGARQSQHQSSSVFDSSARSSRGQTSTNLVSNGPNSAERTMSLAPRAWVIHDGARDFRLSRPGITKVESTRVTDGRWSGEKIGVAIAASPKDAQVRHEDPGERKSSEAVSTHSPTGLRSS